MKGDERRTALLKATIDIVAEGGLNNFSMKKVTDRVGCSEMLIYKHFSTKENLLYCCFESIHTAIGNLFNNISTVMHFGSQKELYTTIRLCWIMYFDYLIKHGNETIYYFTYRDSSYVKKIMQHDEEAKRSYFKEFVDFFNTLDSQLNIYEQVTSNHLWTYILDTTGIFAKRVIREELPNTQESIECIWKLISGGILGLLQTSDNNTAQ